MSSPKKLMLILLLTFFASFIIYLFTYKPFLGCDDAYIYFVYAKNFTNGHGLVYYPAGERVEGFTSLLWVLISSFFYFLTSHFQWLLLMLNVVLIGYALYRLARFVDTYYIAKPSQWVSLSSLGLILILLSIKGYIDWTVISLMETGLWSTLLILNWLFLLELVVKGENTKKQFGLFMAGIGLLVITRPESTLWNIGLIACLFLILYLQSFSFKKTIRRVAPTILVFVLANVALITFRLIYFGYPLPNTYYAKVSTDKIYNLKEGIIYIAKFIYIYPIYFIPIVFGSVAFLWSGYHVLIALKKKENLNKFWLALFVNSVIIMITLLIPLFVGGDHFPLFRLIQPTVPFFLLLLLNPIWKEQFLLMANLQSKKTKWISALLMIMLLTFLYLVNIPKYFVNSEKVPYKLSLYYDFSFAEANKQESIVLNKLFSYSHKPSIGRIWAGGYAFAYDGPTIDLMGLNNTLMAHAIPEKKGLKNHAAFDKKTFYILKPDLLNGQLVNDTTHFVFKETQPGFSESFEWNAFKGIYKDQPFQEMYLPVLIKDPTRTIVYFTYARKDYVDTLRSHDLSVEIIQRIVSTP